MRKRVVITGLGIISPLGNDIETFWKNIVQGKSGVSRITHYDASEYRVQIAAEVKDFDGNALFGNREARRMDRFSQFAVAAAQKTIEDARINLDQPG